jgi:putative transposase
MCDRELNGKTIIENGAKINIKQEDVFIVPSQTNQNKYKVIKNCDGWICTCPDNKYRRHEVGNCKHINAVRYWLELRQYWNADGQYIEKENIIPTCVYCNSLKVVKNGKRKTKGITKTRYLCKDCKKTFIANKEFERISVEPKAITLTLDLYFKGLSLRKIQDTLKQFYGVEVHHETVRRWINHYMKQINSYVDKFQPITSGVIHTDEMMIKEKGKYKWLWNSIDHETKFLIASNVSETRFVKDAKNHFEKVKKGCSAKPEQIITDGLQSYRKSFNKVFYSNRQDCQHIRLKDFRTKPNNNIVERLHGSQRERTKVIRGFKGQAENQMKNWQTYYNFIREHQTLEKTPAEQSGIKLELNHNKWLSLIKKSA